MAENANNPFNPVEHWEQVYAKKELSELSWFQARPGVSYELMQQLAIERDAAIVDIGGGDSLFVDFLLSEGYTNLSVIDISSRAIERAKQRLGEAANKVSWIVADISDSKSDTLAAYHHRFDLWHDRAVLHFFTEPHQVERYIATMRQLLRPATGKAIVGTFAEDGPEKCSGLSVQRYSETMMSNLFERSQMQKIRCLHEEHLTPTQKKQNFLFCSFSSA